MIQVAVSSFVHYDQQGACDNFVFLGQIQGADEIWAETFTVAISWDKWSMIAYYLVENQPFHRKLIQQENKAKN